MNLENTLDMQLVVEEVSKVQREIADIHLNPQKYGIKKEILLKESAKDYTSTVDIAVENFQRRKLKETFTEIGFLGEETDPDIKENRFIWIIDPTDGTGVYAIGGEYYSNSIALVDRKKQEVPFGSVFQSTTARQFIRINGETEVIENKMGKNGPFKLKRKPVFSKSKGFAELMGCSFGTSKYYNLIPGIKEKLEKVFEKQEVPELKREYAMINARPASGSSALFGCDIGDGNRHFALLYFQKAWDLAVGALYARDAGCIVESQYSNTKNLSKWGDGIDLEKQIASCDKKTLINARIFANPDVQRFVMEKFNK